MAEMEYLPNFQKDNYIHPKAAWDKLRMAGARRQNVYLYAATGYGKTELLHRYLRRRRHIWLSGEGLTVETLQEIALPAEATMVIDDLARVLDPAVRREIVSMLDQLALLERAHASDSAHPASASRGRLRRAVRDARRSGGRRGRYFQRICRRRRKHAQDQT